MSNVIILSFSIIFFFNPVSAAAESEDILKKILSEVGFTRDDLGYNPKGYWNRFPLDIPYRLTSFNDLYSEPLKLYDYALVMSHSVELYMEPSYSDSAMDGLYKLVYNLGVDKRLGGFRSYSANLRPPPEGENKILKAVESLYLMAGEELEHYTFGSKYEQPNGKNEIIEKTSNLIDSAKTIIAELILNLGDAIKWRNLAFRNCDYQKMQKVFNIRDLADTQTDGTKYYPEIDDIASSVDWPSLHYAALKVAAASEKAELSLLGLKEKQATDFNFQIATPFGKIVFLSGKTDVIDLNNTLLAIDFGGDRKYGGHIAATSSLENQVSVLIDLGGNDIYGNQENLVDVSQGVGIFGIGCLIDSEGDDNYDGSIFSQGAGFFGVGILMDRAGKDNYKAQLSSQGCGYFGIGLCFDIKGDDEFYLYGDGQGMGGVGGGVGVLASFSGNDRYTAEPYSKIFNRGDYHSKNVINGNNAQGSGFGRRGDGSDGHSWAGGLGVIIDIEGNDHYYSGNWSLGVGYWFATGIAIDKKGDDIYESCYFTQGSGAHFCNGILIDTDGNDKHELFETAGAGLGFGWDFTNAFLINLEGDDSYSAKIISMGLAQIRSNAFLIDIGGDDSYALGVNTAGLGEASYRANYDKPVKLTPYYYYAKSFGGFIDIGGNDSYLQFSKENKTDPHKRAKNNSLWFAPAKMDSTFGANNFGVGIDIEEGTIPEFFKWE